MTNQQKLIMADNPNTTNPSASSLPRVVPLSGPSGCCYTLRLNGHEVLVDAGNKGKPGDVVVLWPKKKCPVIVRRLARTSPYPGEAVGPAGVAMLSDRFYYAVPGTGSMFDVAFKKVAAVHKVVGDL